MTDNKLTDEQIIEDLEFCAKCDFQQCEEQHCTAALDLINRQKAEIERLQRPNKEYRFCNLLGNCLVYSKNLKDYNDMRKGLKSEARKEFAERLKAIYTNDKRYDRPDAHTLLYKLFENIDNLLKEMEGE